MIGNMGSGITLHSIWSYGAYGKQNYLGSSVLTAMYMRNFIRKFVDLMSLLGKEHQDILLDVLMTTL